MKRTRFEEVHRSAMRWPRETFTYIGIDDEGDTSQSYTGEVRSYRLPMDNLIDRSQLENGLKAFEADLYGCRGTLLDKRQSRNPFNRYRKSLSFERLSWPDQLLQLHQIPTTPRLQR